MDKRIQRLEKELPHVSGQKKEDILIEIITAYEEDELYDPAFELLNTYLEDKDYPLHFLYLCGEIYRRKDMNEKAASFFARVIADAQPNDPDKSSSYYEMASIKYEEGEDEAAFSYYDKAIEAGKELLTLTTDENEDLGIYKINLAFSYMDKADLYIEQVSEQESYIFFREIGLACNCYYYTIQLMEEVFEPYPPDADISVNVAMPYTKMYKALSLIENWEPALNYCKKSVDYSQRSSAQQPDSTERKEALANGLADLAGINLRLRYFHNAKKYYKEAKEAFEALYKKKKLREYHDKIVEASTALDMLVRRR